MTMIELEVIAGIDTHADTHHVAVIDTTGRRIGDAEFPTTLKGYKAIAAYVAAFGLVRRVGVEGTHSYGAGITQHLKDSGVRVVEVIRPNRQVRRIQGKTDQVDAYAAASAALATDDHPEPNCQPSIFGAHEKGGVEGEVGRFRRKRLSPMPVVGSLDELRREDPCLGHRRQ